MNDVPRAVTWEAPEHHHTEKSGDWFWALGIIGIAAAAAAFFWGNFLFAVLILVATLTVALNATKEPQILPFAISMRGVRVGKELFPYSTLEAFYIDEDFSTGPQLLIRSDRTFMPLIVIPLPEEFLHEIEDIIGSKLPEEHIEEPFLHTFLEFLGF